MAALYAIANAELSAGVRAVLAPIDRVAFFSLPLRNRFRRVTVREGLLLHGPAGWAEVSPFWDYDAAESVHWLAAGLELATETAPLPVFRAEIPINVTVPVVSPQRAEELVREFVGTHAGRQLTAKVKVADPGVSLAADASRLAAVRAALGPAGLIRIDANAAWSVPEALAALRVLQKAAGGLEYVEQPCKTVAELAQVRRKSEVPVAADESVRRAVDPLAVARAEAADLLVVKLQPMAGIRRVVEVVGQAGLPAVVSSALDSSVGIAAGLRLAASLPQLPFACGLGTARMFTEDVVRVPLLPEGGILPLSEPQVCWDEALLAPRSPQVAERIEAWLRRLEQMVVCLPTPVGR